MCIKDKKAYPYYCELTTPAVLKVLRTFGKVFVFKILTSFGRQIVIFDVIRQILLVVETSCAAMTSKFFIVQLLPCVQGQAVGGRLITGFVAGLGLVSQLKKIFLINFDSSIKRVMDSKLMDPFLQTSNLCYRTVTCKVFIESTSMLLNRPQRKLGQNCVNR